MTRKSDNAQAKPPAPTPAEPAGMPADAPIEAPAAPLTGGAWRRGAGGKLTRIED